MTVDLKKNFFYVFLLFLLIFNHKAHGLVAVYGGQEFQVNSYTAYEQSLPAVTTLSEGDFVVVWASK